MNFPHDDTAMMVADNQPTLRAAQTSRRAREPKRPETTPAVDSTSSAGDADLLTRLRSGDADAFELLIRTHGPRMLAVANRMLGCESNAADAVQEAFLSAWKSLDRFEGGSTLGTWLHRIVVNSALMKLRIAKRRSELSIESLLPMFHDDGHRQNVQPAWSAPADDLLQRQELRQMIRDKVNLLPDDYRTVIMLRDIEELDTEATAEALGITAGAVKTRLHRARMALRQLLERELA